MISVDNLQAARWVRRASCIAAMVMTAAAATVIAFDDPAAAVEMCRGQAATLVGTDGDDRLTGTESSDVIVALGGNDVIRTGCSDWVAPTNFAAVPATTPRRGIWQRPPRRRPRT